MSGCKGWQQDVIENIWALRLAGPSSSLSLEIHLPRDLGQVVSLGLRFINGNWGSLYLRGLLRELNELMHITC